MKVRARFTSQSISVPGSYLQDAALLRRVRCQFEKLNVHVPSMQDISEALSIPERTLRRRLSNMNTSYSLILQDVRRGLAEAALKETDCTVDEIAAMLGYTETANFRHAFRRWAGISPHGYRLSMRSNSGHSNDRAA